MAALLEVLDDASDIIPIFPPGTLRIPARRRQPLDIAGEAIGKGVAAEESDIHTDTASIPSRPTPTAIKIMPHPCM